MVEDWREEAECRNENPELFFPVGTDGPALQQIEQAKTICRRCPVAARCLAAALAGGEDAGIWGGLTAEERRVVRQARARREIGREEVLGQLGEDDAEITDLRGGRSSASRTGWARRMPPAMPPRQEPSVLTERRA